MDILKNKAAIMAILLLLFLTISTVIGGVPIFDMIIFALVQVFFILLPGNILIKACDLKLNNQLGEFFSSYLIGYGLSVFIYLLLSFGHIQRFSLCAYILIAVICLYLFFKKKYKHFSITENKEFVIIVLIITMAYVLGVVAYQFNNLYPSGQSLVSPHKDFMFWMRNCIACSKGYPMPDLSVEGLNLFYHYFSSVHIAFLHSVTSIEFFDLCFTYTTFIITILLTGGAYLLSTELIKNKKYALIATAAILFTSNLEGFNYLFYSAHIFGGSFGLGEGLGYTLFSVFLFLRIIKSDSVKLKQLVLTLFSFFIAIGLKAPLALVLLAAIGVSCFAMLLDKKTIYKSFVIGIPSLVVFILVYILFIMTKSGFGVDTTSRPLSFSLFFTSGMSGVESRLLQSIIHVTGSSLLGNIITFIFYFLFTFSVPLILYVYVKIEKIRIHFEVSTLFLVSISVVGFLATSFVVHNGMSQMYYWFIGYPVTIVFLLHCVGDSECTLANLQKYFVSFALIIGIIGASSGIVRKSIDGLRNVTNLSKTVIKNDAFSYSLEELQALRWVRDNTPESAIIASNKVLSENGERSFIVSCFTERQTVIEGYEYSVIADDYRESLLAFNKKLFSTSTINVENDIEKYGVNYIIIFKTLPFNTVNEINNNVVFENQQVKVIQI